MSLLSKVTHLLSNPQFSDKLEEAQLRAESVLSIHSQISKHKPPVTSGTTCPICRKAHKNGDRTFFYDIICRKCQEEIDNCKHLRVSKNQFYALSWGVYGGHLRDTIFQIKYSSREIGEKYKDRKGFISAIAHKLNRFSNRRLVSACLDEFALSLSKLWWEDWERRKVPQSAIVVPIPLALERFKERGYNQAALLAKPFAWYSSLKYEENGLKRIKETPPLFDLKPKERIAALDGVFALGDRFLSNKPKEPIILVDDIYTTGATINAARSVFERNGIKYAGVVTLAAVTNRRKNCYQAAGESMTRGTSIAVIGSNDFVNLNGLYNAIQDLLREMPLGCEILVRDDGTGADVLAASIASERGMEVNPLLPNQIVTLADAWFIFAKKSDPDEDLRSLAHAFKTSCKPGKIFVEPVNGNWYYQ